MSGALPKCDRQRRSLITAIAFSLASSAGENLRPTIGCKPMVSNALAVIAAVATRSAPPSVMSVMPVLR